MRTLTKCSATAVTILELRFPYATACGHRAADCSDRVSVLSTRSQTDTHLTSLEMTDVALDKRYEILLQHRLDTVLLLADLEVRLDAHIASLKSVYIDLTKIAGSLRASQIVATDPVAVCNQWC